MQSGGKNIRVVVMNNVLPRVVKMHLKFDLKGSTYKRRASKKEKEKSIPTYKDLDFIQDMPEGLMLDADTFSALVKTLQRDCLVRRGWAGAVITGLPSLSPGFPTCKAGTRCEPEIHAPSLPQPHLRLRSCCRNKAPGAAWCIQGGPSPHIRPVRAPSCPPPRAGAS